MPQLTLSDRVLTAIKNNRVAAAVIVAATIIVGAAQLSGALDTIYRLIRGDSQARAIYRPLIADVDLLHRSVQSLAALHWSPTRTQTVVLAYLAFTETSAEPVCNARHAVSVLGDTTTRRQLDGICAAVQTMRQLANVTHDGAGATALAVVVDSLGMLSRLQDSLRSRM